MDKFNGDFNADDILKDFKAQFKMPNKEEYAAVMKPTKRPMRVAISLLITAVISAIAYYFMLPALNLHSTDLYVFAILVIAIFLVTYLITCGLIGRPVYKEYAKASSKVPLILVGVIILVMLVGYLTGATIFRARSYNQLMDVKQSDFNEDFEEIGFSEVPRLDADSTKTLADNKLNELSQYVSQFLVADTTTQINYKGTPVRVAPLVYGDFFKWMNNTKNGLPAYMVINMVTQEVSVVQLENGMRYSPSELFNRRLERHLRFQYPTAIFDHSNFEIDDDGHPYWITASLTKKIGLFGGTDVKGAVITDAVTGESTYYNVEDVPNWVDRVYSDDLILEQYNYYGTLQKGFINSVIGQKDVKITSAGNGYIAMDDDVWVYTGVTSAGSDASNVGFILSNQRTKETRYYEIGGSTETGAMQSAQGAVQNYGYRASFPILLNVSGEPTYFMPLKDSSNMVKQYAMVNFKQRTVFGIGTSPEACSQSYTEALVANNIVNPDNSSGGSDTDAGKHPEVTGAIQEIRTSVKDGNTYYYFKIDNKYYSISANKNDEVVIFNVGDTVTATYKEYEAENMIIPLNSIKLA